MADFFSLTHFCIWKEFGWSYEKNLGIYPVLPPNVFSPPVTNYILIYSTLQFKRIARAPGGRKKQKLTKVGRGGQNGIDLNSARL